MLKLSKRFVACFVALAYAFLMCAVVSYSSDTIEASGTFEVKLIDAQNTEYTDIPDNDSDITLKINASVALEQHEEEKEVFFVAGIYEDGRLIATKFPDGGSRLITDQPTEVDIPIGKLSEIGEGGGNRIRVMIWDGIDGMLPYYENLRKYNVDTGQYEDVTAPIEYTLQKSEPEPTPGLESALKEGVKIPVIDGDWWYVTTDDPVDMVLNKDDPNQIYAITNNISSNVCDFTIYQSEDGKWHIVACIRGVNEQNAATGTPKYEPDDPKFVPSNRLFYHWETDDFTKRELWEEKGIFAMSQEIGSFADNPPVIRGLQAPHAVVDDDGKYYMYYNSQGAYCITSEDGMNWKTDGEWNRLTNPENGSFIMFDMGRDVMIFDDTANTGLYYAYYCGRSEDSPDVDVFAYRTATSLDGPWSSVAYSARKDGNPESPFIIYKDGFYYLWQQGTVFVSETPTDFDGYAPITNMTRNNGWAPEIIDCNGEQYIVVYGNKEWNTSGLMAAKIKWVDPGQATPVIHGSWSGPGEVGKAYTVTYRASGGNGLLTWEIIGDLPPGLAIVASDSHDSLYEMKVAGTPTQAGTYPCTLKVTDEKGKTATANTTFTIAEAP